MKDSFLNKKLLILGAICVLTFICFRYTLNNQFTNWDDDFYVTNDPYIKSFTAENLKAIFTQDITKNNFHPLCMLSLAINYHFSQLNPEAYYLTNVLIHIANVILVFFLLLQLCVRLKADEVSQLFIAGFGALWFGIHPMRVESVSWIAERKDVLYAFFYFAGLLTYLQYLSSNKMKWYWATYALFVASCLSKPMAVVFPFSLLCLDVLLQRPLGKKLVIEKIIFFASSLVCGGAAIYTQHKTGAIASFDTLTLAERIMYASYGFVMYLVKVFNPTYLSTFYPYPYRYISGYLPVIYYAAPLISIAVVALPLYYTYKRNKAYFWIVAFGMGYFVANVMFELQFMSVGAAIMADRYSYVAYFGLFFMIFFFLNEIRKRFPAYKTALLVVLLCASGGLAYGCYERTYVWHDSETLLSDAIEKYPMRALLSYKWLGNYYLDQGDYDKALENYEVLTTLRAADARVYDRIAVIYAGKKEYQKAFEAFQKSLEVQNNVYKTYIDRSLVYAAMGDTTNSLKDFVTAYQLGKDQDNKENKAEKALSDSCFNFVQNKRFDLAIKEYDMLLNILPANPFYYFYRGVAEYSTDRLGPAMNDWLVAVRFNNRDVKQSASYDLCVAFDALGNDSLAVYYGEMAIGAGYDKMAPDYLAGLKQKKAQQQAGRINPQH